MTDPRDLDRRMDMERQAEMERTTSTPWGWIAAAAFIVILVLVGRESGSPADAARPLAL